VIAFFLHSVNDSLVHGFKYKVTFSGTNAPLFPQILVSLHLDEMAHYKGHKLPFLQNFLNLNKKNSPKGMNSLSNTTSISLPVHPHSFGYYTQPGSAVGAVVLEAQVFQIFQ